MMRKRVRTSGECSKGNQKRKEEDDSELLRRACAECATNCLLAHGKRKNSSGSVNRFFKVMLGADFSSILYLPPRFSRTYLQFENQEAYLEDSIGQQFKVALSIVEGSLAIQKGWQRFSVEHGLEEGDFLAFHHVHLMRKHHFFVHIFGPSGCEKLIFPQKHAINGLCTGGNAAAPDEALKTQATNSAGKQISSTCVVSKSHFEASPCQLMTPNDTQGNNYNGGMLQLDPAAGDMEEPLYMLNRDNGQIQDDRLCLYDLSTFEKPREKGAADEVNRIDNGGGMPICRPEKNVMPKKELSLVDTLLVQREVSSSGTPPYREGIDVIDNINESEPVDVAPEVIKFVNGGEGSADRADKITKTQTQSGLAHSSRLQREVSSPGATPYGAEIEMTKNINESRPVNIKRKITDKSAAVGIMNSHLRMSSEKSAEIKNYHVNADLNARQEDSRAVKSRNFPVSAPVLKNPVCKIKKDVKKELVEMGEKLCGPPKFMHVNKPTFTSENVPGSFSEDAKIKTEPVDALDISPLFADILAEVDGRPYQQLKSSLPKVSFRGPKSRVIYLRAPDRRLWPILYHERRGFQVLSSGWESFKSNYQILPGDKCLIELEDGQERIYSLRIIRE